MDASVESKGGAVEAQSALSRDIHLLGDLLGETLRAQEGDAFFALEEEVRTLAKARRSGNEGAAQILGALIARHDTATLHLIALAFTAYFDLVNLAEEQHRVRVLRARERTTLARDESIARALAEFRQRGIPAQRVAALMDRLAIELVFTAHPTEARRRTILSKLAHMAVLLYEWDRPDLLPRERAQLEQQLRIEIHTLWLTERARTTRPEVTDEVRIGLFYFDTILWEAVLRLYDDLRRALAQYYPEVPMPPRFLTFGSWIGGDRDGNPFVTTAVTAEALCLNRGLAVEKHRAALRRLERALSVSDRRAAISEALRASLERDRTLANLHTEPAPATADSQSLPVNSHDTTRRLAWLHRRYPHEPYRLKLATLARELDETTRDDVTARLLGIQDPPLPRLRCAAQLAHELDLIDESLRAGRGAVIAEGELQTLRDQVRVFGLHTARLDLRQEAACLMADVDSLLYAYRLAPAFAQMPPPAQERLLTELLLAPPRPLSPGGGLSTETNETIALFHLLARTYAAYGAEPLGVFVISMTETPANVLAVLLLAHWAGIADQLDLVPLFETMEALEQSPQVMRALFTNPAYARHLAARAAKQQVMVGYSDSNKECGLVAANWALYRAQRELARVCREHGVTLTLFHGRGGSIARGGGPPSRMIGAQPPGTLEGRFRMTEQGEVLAARYGNSHLAHRHLEQIVYAVLHMSIESEDDVPAEWHARMDELSAAGLRAYRALVYETPRFVEFWEQATPIHEIEQLRIGSRPAHRRTLTSIQTLRAIPWVFSWMQSRFNLPGWYGLGSALKAVAGDTTTPRGEACLQELQRMAREWRFFKTMLTNVQNALGKADMGIAAQYAQLVNDATLREQIWGRIRDEFACTRAWILRLTEQSEILDHEPVLQHSIRVRNPYVDPLNFIQIELLRRLRALPDDDHAARAELMDAMVVTINGIAAGLRNTG